MRFDQWLFEEWSNFASTDFHLNSKSIDLQPFDRRDLQSKYICTFVRSIVVSSSLFFFMYANDFISYWLSCLWYRQCLSILNKQYSSLDIVAYIDFGNAGRVPLCLSPSHLIFSILQLNFILHNPIGNFSDYGRLL